MHVEAKDNDSTQPAAMVTPPVPHSSANECAVQNQSDPAVPDGMVLGLDYVDLMGIIGLPTEMEKGVTPSMSRLSTDLARGGSTCGAAKRLAARDVAAARTRLRLMEGLQSQILTRCAQDPDALRQAESLQNLIMAEHRRLVAAMEMLRRADRTPSPVAIKINRAAVMVNR